MRGQHSLAALALAAVASCQTPGQTQPAAEQYLQVKWNGGLLAPNQTLPRSFLYAPPAISLNWTAPGPATFMMVMADLSIPVSWLPSNTSAMEIAQGIAPDRTTWLQWLQTGYTQAPNGSFYSSAAPVAPYGYPNPPAGDGPHTYVIYLFPQIAQGDGTSLPGLDANRSLYATDAPDRLNFDLTGLAEVAGFPVAANHFQVNADGSTSASGGNGSSATATVRQPGSAATASGAGSVETQATNGAGMLVPGLGVGVLSILASFML